MLIEERIGIAAPLAKVWDRFVDLTCWADWNRVLTDVRPSGTCLSGGEGFSCCIRPYFFDIHFSPVVVAVDPLSRVIWTAERFGISARHEFLFHETTGGMEIISREKFSGIFICLGVGLLIRPRLRRLTRAFLEDLRQGAEA